MAQDLALKRGMRRAAWEARGWQAGEEPSTGLRILGRGPGWPGVRVATRGQPLHAGAAAGGGLPAGAGTDVGSADGRDPALSLLTLPGVPGRAKQHCGICAYKPPPPSCFSVIGGSVGVGVTNMCSGDLVRWRAAFRGWGRPPQPA